MLRTEIQCGLYGDLVGNVERLRPEDHDVLVVVLEWSDLDPRLGVRALGSWDFDTLPDIVRSAKCTLQRLEHALKTKLPLIPVYLCLPTLPLPPIFFNGTIQACTLELTVRCDLLQFAQALSVEKAMKIVSAQHLDEQSSFNERLNLRGEIMHGFPYQTAHASVIGEALAGIINPPEPRKGLITDLDETLWAGVLGDVGVSGVHWNIDQQAHLHGLYQQFLASLASTGVLIGAATKNERDIVDRVFERGDLLLTQRKIFPIEAHWGPKSESVHKILSKWNVLPESVIFVDDNPMEVAEVQQSFPGMECLLFPKCDHDAFWLLLNHLRSRFAKATVFDEDLGRLESVRHSQVLRLEVERDRPSMDTFLQEAKGQLTFRLSKGMDDGRVFELINKTNQFNLNGERYDRATWSDLIKDPTIICVTASYEDKFGKLGVIAVLITQRANENLFIKNWVMSCRAFSRRIEHQCIQFLFDKFGVVEITFDIRVTGRNAPMIDFLQQLANGPLQRNLTVARSSFFQKAPKMPHIMREEFPL